MPTPTSNRFAMAFQLAPATLSASISCRSTVTRGLPSVRPFALALRKPARTLSAINDHSPRKRGTSTCPGVSACVDRRLFNWMRFRLVRDLSQTSACCLNVMLEVVSINACVELTPSFSSFSAAARSAMVRVRWIPIDRTFRTCLSCPGTSHQYSKYAGSLGNHPSVLRLHF